MNIKPYSYDSGFYNVGMDIEKYPDALFYLVWSYRGPGKTTGGLWYMAYNGHKFIYMKRTNDDVDFMCGKTKAGNIDFDVSPFKTVNRLAGCNVRARSISQGVGGFYDTNEKGEAYGAPLGYILSFNKIKSIKGADMSECDYIIFDEFIPQVHEQRVSQKEGEALLDFVRTVSRDRIGRGLPPIKVILFANSEDIACPITSTLEVIDTMAELTASGRSHTYIKDRKIMLHHILKEEAPGMTDTYDKDPLRVMMKGTQWEKKSYDGDFANNDFSCIKKLNMREMKLYIVIKYKKNNYYIYFRERDSIFYMTFSPSDQEPDRVYDLNREVDQKNFWSEDCQSLRCDLIEDRMRFEKYSMYDLIINYKKYFKV